MVEPGDRRHDEVLDTIIRQFAGRTSVGLTEAARILEMSTKTLSRHVMRREVKYVQLGFGKIKKRRMFTVEELAGFMSRRRLLENSLYDDVRRRTRHKQR